MIISINSHNFISWQGIDIVRRKLSLVTINKELITASLKWRLGAWNIQGFPGRGRKWLTEPKLHLDAFKPRTTARGLILTTNHSSYKHTSHSKWLLFFFQFLQYHVIGDSKPLVSFSSLLKFWLLTVYMKVISYNLAQYFIKIGNSFWVTLNLDL